MNTFRIPAIHRNSPTMRGIIRDISKMGYFFFNDRKCKLVNARKEMEMIHLEVEYL